MGVHQSLLRYSTVPQTCEGPWSGPPGAGPDHWFAVMSSTRPTQDPDGGTVAGPEPPAGLTWPDSQTHHLWALRDLSSSSATREAQILHGFPV